MKQKISSRIIRFVCDACFFGGVFLFLHGFANEMYYKALRLGQSPYSQILAPQGEYIGIVMAVSAYVVLRFLGWNKKRKNNKN